MGRRPSSSKPENKDKKDGRGDRNNFGEPVKGQQPDQAGGPYPGKMNSQLANSVKDSRRNMTRTAVRRSRRIKDIDVTPLNRGIQDKDPVIEEDTITDSEEEEGQFVFQEEEEDQYDFEDDELPHRMSTLIEENTEDKIDYLIILLEAQGKKIDSLMSKNEALTQENCELTMKITIVESKIEILMSNPQYLADLAGKVRDIVMLDSVPTPAFTAISSQDGAVRVPKTIGKRGKYQRK